MAPPWRGGSRGRVVAGHAARPESRDPVRRVRPGEPVRRGAGGRPPPVRLRRTVGWCAAPLSPPPQPVVISATGVGVPVPVRRGRARRHLLGRRDSKRLPQSRPSVSPRPASHGRCPGAGIPVGGFRPHHASVPAADQSGRTLLRRRHGAPSARVPSRHTSQGNPHQRPRSLAAELVCVTFGPSTQRAREYGRLCPLAKEVL